MKHLFFLFLFLSVLPVQGQINPKPVTVSIKQFGARGDGKTNDHAAFIKASNYINKAKRNVILLIPYGTYIVGKQVASMNYFMQGEDVLRLENCRNVRIVGERRGANYSKIKFANNLYYGSFYHEGPKKFKPKCSPVSHNYSKKNAAFIGSCFMIIGCSNIAISNIEIDGNQAGMKIGGNYGDKGIQLNHRGVYTQSSSAIRLDNMDIHHLALDGIEVAGSRNTTLNNVSSTYNGRQGMSWVNGDGLMATNCKFNYTGNARIASAPGAGVDIEPEGGVDIQDGVFTNCEFNYNVGSGVLYDRNARLVRNMLFKNCTMVGYSNWALWMMGTRVRYEDCQIFGHVAHSVRSVDVNMPSDITTYTRCTFSNVYDGRYCKAMSPYMLEFNNEKIRMEDCQINAHRIGFLWYTDNDLRSGLQSQVINTNVVSNNNANNHASTTNIKFQNCVMKLTVGVNNNLNGIATGGNTLTYLTQSALDTMLGTKDIKVFQNTINPYICSEL